MPVPTPSKTQIHTLKYWVLTSSSPHVFFLYLYRCGLGGGIAGGVLIATGGGGRTAGVVEDQGAALWYLLVYVAGQGGHSPTHRHCIIQTTVPLNVWCSTPG